ncbi:hypothetical protein Ancab_001959 [Ancistrocladus abbreviatus]
MVRTSDRPGLQQSGMGFYSPCSDGHDDDPAIETKPFCFGFFKSDVQGLLTRLSYMNVEILLADHDKELGNQPNKLEEIEKQVSNTEMVELEMPNGDDNNQKNESTNQFDKDLMGVKQSTMEVLNKDLNGEEKTFGWIVACGGYENLSFYKWVSSSEAALDDYDKVDMCE